MLVAPFTDITALWLIADYQAGCFRDQGPPTDIAGFESESKRPYDELSLKAGCRRRNFSVCWYACRH